MIRAASGVSGDGEPPGLSLSMLNAMSHLRFPIAQLAHCACDRNHAIAECRTLSEPLSSLSNRRAFSSQATNQRTMIVVSYLKPARPCCCSTK